MSRLVFSGPAGAAGSMSAAITQGGDLFTVDSIESFKWVLEFLDDNGETPGHTGRTRIWQQEGGESTNGGGPINVVDGQWLSVFVSVNVRDGVAPPGPLAGTLEFRKATSSSAMPLDGVYLGVDRASPIGKRWAALGGEPQFGDALGNEGVGPFGRGKIQGFAKGLLYEPPGLPVVFMSEALFAKWTTNDSSRLTPDGKEISDVLGEPIADVDHTTEGGTATRFEHGMIVIRAAGQGYFTYGPIYDAFERLGSISDRARPSPLGPPISEIQPAGTLGLFQTFDLGDVYWSAATGAHEMHGPILGRWLEQGGVHGVIGLPTSDQIGTADGVGAFNTFPNALIYSNGEGAWEIHGPILAEWSSLDREKSYLRYPASNVEPWTDPATGLKGSTTRFDRGSIFLTSDGKATAVPDEHHPDPQIIVTPDGTTWGGEVDMTLRSDGTYKIHYHAHGSSIIRNYQFTIRAIYATPGGYSLMGEHGDELRGVDTKDFDDDNGGKPVQAIIDLWPDILNGRFYSAKDYSETGVIGAILDVAKAIVDIGATVTGGVVGVVIGLGDDIGRVFGGLNLAETFGIIGGVVVFVSGGSLVLAVVEGVAAGAVTQAVINSRSMKADEVAFAKVVFGDELSTDRIQLTNLAGLGGRAFTFPLGGTTYVNLASGEALDDPRGYFTKDDHGNPAGAYSTPGQLFIHELTHAWQVEHSTFLPGVICGGIVNQTNFLLKDNPYVYGPPSVAWSDFNLEAQGAIVDQWFAGDPTIVVPFRAAQDKGDPYYKFIRDNILKGQT